MSDNFNPQSLNLAETGEASLEQSNGLQKPSARIVKLDAGDRIAVVDSKGTVKAVLTTYDGKGAPSFLTVAGQLQTPVEATRPATQKDVDAGKASAVGETIHSGVWQLLAPIGTRFGAEPIINPATGKAVTFGGHPVKLNVNTFLTPSK